jgi:hypothetical protein
MRGPLLFATVALFLGVVAADLCAQGNVAPTSTPTIRIAGPGLTLLRYGPHASQANATNSTGYVHYNEFGTPLKAPRTVTSISKWTKENDEENAVLSGYIKIEMAGTYGFRTNSDWDRNELIVNGKIVCPFRDGSNIAQSIELPAGLIPIVSVSYSKTTRNSKEVLVQWLPPGQKTWTDIPNNLLSHPPYAQASVPLR